MDLLDVMPTNVEAFDCVSTYYLNFIGRNAAQADLLDLEWSQIQPALAWLADHHPHGFLSSVIALSPYLQKRSLNSLWIAYCQRGLQLAESLKQASARLWLEFLKACFAMGWWDEALKHAQKSISLSQNDDPRTYAQALLQLGHLQINRGEFRAALATLKKAEGLLIAQNDVTGIAEAQAEVAAYYLVKGEYTQALQCYLAIEAMFPPHDERASHAVFMLGVVNRRLKNNVLATEYLQKIFDQAILNKDRASMATALHHLAWVKFDQGAIAEAEWLGIKAQLIYKDIHDPRGFSDADEQLGMLALCRNDLESASFYLERALATRRSLGNRPGAASAQRRLAIVYLRRRKLWKGCRCFWRSFLLHLRMHTLSYRKAINFLKVPS